MPASFSPQAWSATACSTSALSRSSAQPLASTCWRYAASTASAADGVPLGQEHPGPAERELILPGQLRGCSYLALAQQDQHLDRGNLRQPRR